MVLKLADADNLCMINEEEKLLFQLTKQRLCAQATTKRENPWFADAGPGAIKRRMLENSSRRNDDNRIPTVKSNHIVQKKNSSSLLDEKHIHSQTQDNGTYSNVIDGQKGIYGIINAKLKEISCIVICKLKKSDQ